MSRVSSPPLTSISPPSLSLALSHKSHLPNSCLRSEIILRLFFTVAAQRWICKRFFFSSRSPSLFCVCVYVCVRARAPVCVRCSCLVISQQCRRAAWFEGKCSEKRWLVETGLWIFYGRERGGVEGFGVRGRGPLPAPASSAGSSNNGRLPHLSQREHIYISSPRGTLRDEVSSNWIWISLHQG